MPRFRVGIGGNPKASTSYRTQDWLDAITQMTSAGGNLFPYSKRWADIEPTAGGAYAVDDVRLMMDKTTGLPVEFNLMIIDSGARNMPDAYKGLAWDSPQMIDRVTKAVDALAPILGGRVWSYALGNEIDLYFKSRSGEIAAFGRLLAAVKPVVKAHHPEARFTTCFQAAAAPGLNTVYAPVVTALDAIALTYYPVQSDFSVRPPDAVVRELAALVDAVRPKPLVLQEFGYPSDPLLGSSPDLQARFVKSALETIRAIGSPSIPAANYVFQAELPEWLVSQMVKEVGIDSPRFRAFLQSLGLRDTHDAPKPGWDEFVRQTALSMATR